MKKVYLDNAATTQIRGEVIDKILEALSCYGNPSSTHEFGRSAKTKIEKARKTIAKYINANASEITFTSGGTEADNIILKSAVRDLNVEHIITAKTEHHAVLHTINHLKDTHDIKVSFVALDENGTPDIKDLESLLINSKNTILVSLMHINNEIGNMIPIDDFATLCKKYNAYFHSDTVQSIGHWNWDVQKTTIDFLTAAAHKFHGPKGVGFVYIRKGIPLKPLIHGGEQERGKRAGTESFHNIVGMEEAMIQAYENLDQEKTYITNLKKHFIKSLEKHIPYIHFNGTSGDIQKSTYTLVSVRLPVSLKQATMLLFQLDIKGIACSQGSACQSGSTTGSHVLQAVLDKEEIKHTSIRFSFSKYNTVEEIDYVVDSLQALLSAEQKKSIKL